MNLSGFDRTHARIKPFLGCLLGGRARLHTCTHGGSARRHTLVVGTPWPPGCAQMHTMGGHTCTLLPLRSSSSHRECTIRHLHPGTRMQVVCVKHMQWPDTCDHVWVDKGLSTQAIMYGLIKRSCMSGSSDHVWVHCTCDHVWVDQVLDVNLNTKHSRSVQRIALCVQGSHARARMALCWQEPPSRILNDRSEATRSKRLGAESEDLSWPPLVCSTRWYLPYIDT